MILIFVEFDIFNALDQLSGFGSVEDLKFSNISVKVSVAIFRVKESEAAFAETSESFHCCTQRNAEIQLRALNSTRKRQTCGIDF
jgi:hypothetical protein